MAGVGAARRTMALAPFPMMAENRVRVALGADYRVKRHHETRGAGMSETCMWKDCNNSAYYSYALCDDHFTIKEGREIKGFEELLEIIVDEIAFNRHFIFDDLSLLIGNEDAIIDKDDETITISIEEFNGIIREYAAVSSVDRLADSLEQFLKDREGQRIEDYSKFHEMASVVDALRDAIRHGHKWMKIMNADGNLAGSSQVGNMVEDLERWVLRLTDPILSWKLRHAIRDGFSADYMAEALQRMTGKEHEDEG